jgi:hypothetical protein
MSIPEVSVGKLNAGELGCYPGVDRRSAWIGRRVPFLHGLTEIGRSE